MMQLSKLSLTRAGFAVCLFGASIVGTAGMASAQSTTSTSGTATASTPDRPARAQLTDAQKACLVSKGITLPAKPAEAPGGDAQPGPGAIPPARPQPTEAQPTEAQRAAMDSARVACGLPARAADNGGHGPGGPGANRPQLTDAQKACLTTNGFAPPAKPAGPGDGTNTAANSRPEPPDRATFETAAAACGITLPARPAQPAAAA